ncbi:MAG: family 31 glucosidase, partial [Clostridia bacterium]|nr:family 31 glucosidase [Clostridia bacterium]
MRPLWYVYPDDPACGGRYDEYLFGPDLLVCPVLEAGARERTVYLPAGRWKDLETSRTLEGAATVTVPAPLDVIPVFERL